VRGAVSDRTNGHRFAGGAVKLEAVGGPGHLGDRGHGPLARDAGELDAEQVAAEVDVALDVDFVLRSVLDELLAVRPKQIAGRLEIQSREPVAEREMFAFLDLGRPQTSRHDAILQ
jgi:hypothetical protein